MFKKLSMILAAATLCTNMGIVAPVSAQAATEDVLLIESNFQNCNLGTYSAENQKGEDGEADLRNGIVMFDDSDLSTGYTIKNGDVYEDISEADIVMDGGTKVLRLNSFLNTYKLTNEMTQEEANYPLVKTIGRVPKNNKVRIDLEVKTSPRVYFYLHHSKPIAGEGRIWRLQNGGSSASQVRVLNNTITGASASCDKYHTHTAIMDTATGHMKIYLDGALIWESTEAVKGIIPTWDQELFFRQDTPDLKPTVTYNTEDATKIESVLNPQYVYVKSLKMTTYTDTAFESVTPANESSVMAPTESVFTFNREIKKVEKATVHSWGDDKTVDVTSSLIFDGKTVKVPYTFEVGEEYTVSINGASDGFTSTDAETSFTAEEWNFSNLTGTPVNTAPADNNTYLVNEDFTNSDATNLITTMHEACGTAVLAGDVSIVELAGGNKALKFANGSDFRITYKKWYKLLDNTTTLSYDVYLEKDVKQFNVDMEFIEVAHWKAGYYKQSGDENVPGTGPMTAGEWHKVDITISETTGITIYVDGKAVHNEPKDATLFSNVNFFRFKAHGANVIVDNLKLYTNKSGTVLTDVAPAYDAADVKASTPLEFTYNELIGDVSNAKLVLKPNDTNEAVELTNGNGISVDVENYTVKVIPDEALNANLGYAVEFSGLKDVYGAEVAAVRTKFSTVADDSEWIMTDIATEVSGPLNRNFRCLYGYI